jgi:hypothetical protein
MSALMVGILIVVLNGLSPWWFAAVLAAGVVDSVMRTLRTRLAMELVRRDEIAGMLERVERMNAASRATLDRTAMPGDEQA